jgi:hypothetical protein
MGLFLHQNSAPKKRNRFKTLILVHISYTFANRANSKFVFEKFQFISHGGVGGASASLWLC